MSDVVFSGIEFFNSSLPAYIAAFSTLGLLWVALFQAKRAVDNIVETNKKSSQQASLDYLSQHVDLHLELREVVRKVPNSADLIDPENIIRMLFEYDENDNGRMRDILTNHLNQRELMAYGIKVGNLDDDLFKSLLGPTILNEWKYCEAFILRSRELNPNAKLYVGYEELAKKWSNEVLN